MTAREQAIEAGARALESGDFDYYPCDHGTYMQSCADCLAAAVVDAVEPIIRADEREKHAPPIVLNMVEEVNRRDDAERDAVDEYREQIAQDLDYLASIATHPREALAFFAAARVARRGLHT